MAAEDQNLHALFLPYLITSHMIPLTDTALLFAARRGVTVTILTTPSNALTLKPSVDRAAASGHRIAFHTVEFPAAEAGLPDVIENFGAITSKDMIPKVSLAISLLQKPMEQAMRELRPHCIVSDVMQPWTADIAAELNIPRLILSTTNCFSECVYYQLEMHKPFEKAESESEIFVVPGLPDEIEMTSAELENYLKAPEESGNTGDLELLKLIKEAEIRSYGMIFTSFSEIEPDYVHHYKSVMKRKSWHVGLPSLCLGKEKETNSKRHKCLDWLDSQETGSVLYVSFGSLTRFPDAQFTEIALALEESGHPFLWLVKKIGKESEEEDEEWLPEGFLERLQESNRGLIMIRDWAPQIPILAHAAIGGFVTQCGWNSAAEGMAAGVPMITWPLFAEQFYNEKLITQVLKIGVEVGSGVWNRSPRILSPVLGKDKIVKAVIRLMGGSEEAAEIRLRAKEVSVMVNKSVEEGGSCSSELNGLIEELKAYVLHQ